MSAMPGVALKLALKAALCEANEVFCQAVDAVRQPGAGAGALLTVTETEAVPTLPAASLACAEIV
jgi:hypothetical protein